MNKYEKLEYEEKELIRLYNRKSEIKKILSNANSQELELEYICIKCNLNHQKKLVNELKNNK